MKKDTHVYISRNPARIGNEVIVHNRLDGGTVEVYKHNGETTLVHPTGAYDPDAYTFYATDEQLRELYQAIKEHLRLGTDKSYTDGKLEQTEKHLNDMRVIALSSLKLDKHI